MSDVKIIGRAIPQQFDTYKLGMKGNVPADGELIYENSSTKWMKKLWSKCE